MQHKNLATPCYRSLADRRLIINKDQSVVTLRANSKKPYRAILFIERLVDSQSDSSAGKWYDLCEVAYFSRNEYGSPNAWNNISTQYGVNGPGILVASISHNALYIENFSYLSRVITNKIAAEIILEARNLRNQYYEHLEQKTSLDFFSDLLKKFGVLDKKELVVLTPNPFKKKYSEETLKMWGEATQNLTNPLLIMKLKQILRKKSSLPH